MAARCSKWPAKARLGEVTCPQSSAAALCEESSLLHPVGIFGGLPSAPTFSGALATKRWVSAAKQAKKRRWDTKECC